VQKKTADDKQENQTSLKNTEAKHGMLIPDAELSRAQTIQFYASAIAALLIKQLNQGEI